VHDEQCKEDCLDGLGLSLHASLIVGLYLLALDLSNARHTVRHPQSGRVCTISLSLHVIMHYCHALLSCGHGYHVLPSVRAQQCESGRLHGRDGTSAALVTAAGPPAARLGGGPPTGARLPLRRCAAAGHVPRCRPVIQSCAMQPAMLDIVMCSSELTNAYGES
jgi:hypothetical protein